MKLVVFAVLLFVVVCWAHGETNLQDPASRSVPIEREHSLVAPLDSMASWYFGGSAVLTKRFVRLTPSTQDRRGWIWNEYPLESDSWETEFKIEIYSKPHFGGDGMAFWVLNETHDPSLISDPELLSGPIFGMLEKFNGFGVAIDIYDNDNRRDNPAIFVIRNDGSEVKWNHDADYVTNMVTKTSKTTDGKHSANSYRCVADVRNTGRVSKVFRVLLMLGFFFHALTI